MFRNSNKLYAAYGSNLNLEQMKFRCPYALPLGINRHFDLRPSAIIERLGLRRPIFAQTAAYGHFGRDDLDLPWERLDMVEALRAEK